jgi:peptidoglycan/LPS O-acetylase OafA/YrhL
MAFYCMVPFLFKKITTLKKAIGFFLATLVFAFVCLYIYRKAVTSTSDLESFIYFWLPNQLPVFSLGLIIYFLCFHNVNNKINELFYPLTILCSLVVVALFAKFSIFGDHIIFGIAAALFIYLLKFKRFPGLINGITLYLGKISYSLYLCQYAAIFILQKTGLFSFFPGKRGGYALLNVSVNLLALFITACFLSYLLYHTIEVPFQKLGKQFLRKKEELVFSGPDTASVIVVRTFQKGKTPI